MKKDNWQDDIDASGQRLTNWRQNNPKATLTEIELSVEAELSILRKRLVTDLLQQTSEREPTICPNCKQQMVKNGRFGRELQGKEGTTIKVERAQMKCQQCGMTFFPSG